MNNERLIDLLQALKAVTTNDWNGLSEKFDAAIVEATAASQPQPQTP